MEQNQTVTVHDFWGWGTKVDCALQWQSSDLVGVRHPKLGLCVVGRWWLVPFAQRPEWLRRAQADVLTKKRVKGKHSIAFVN